MTSTQANFGLNGVITSRHVVTNMRDIVSGFGWGAWFRCLKVAATGKRTTFLATIWK